MGIFSVIIVYWGIVLLGVGREKYVRGCVYEFGL